MTHLIAIDVESGEQVDLSGVGNLVHDSSAVPSADGAWIAFKRKEVEGPGATRGSQIWRMRPDGTQADCADGRPRLRPRAAGLER